MPEQPGPNPLVAHILGKVQDREDLERAKAHALLAVGQRLDQVLEELRAMRPLLEELVVRGRKP